MKEAQPAPAATGQEQQFTPGVMARLFPKPIISPEYTEQGITFRFKAPDAKKVELDTEFRPENIVMEKDSDGVWSTTVTDFIFETFVYCFVVDGMPGFTAEDNLGHPALKPHHRRDHRHCYTFAGRPADVCDGLCDAPVALAEPTRGKTTRDRRDAECLPRALHVRIPYPRVQ